MQTASTQYKAAMKQKFRNNLSYIRVTIGLINQQAQAEASIPDSAPYTYYSNLAKPMDNYHVTELYAACDQDYTKTDGSMYFLPREKEDVVLNAGIVTERLLGSIEICFPTQFDMKGLTIEFGNAYPEDFTIESDHNTVEIIGNSHGHFVTEEIFTAATYLRFTPSKMINGQSRLRIHQITMGIGIYFDNRKILSASKKEHLSPIMEELPTIDLDLTIENRDRTYDIENSKSTVNFLEPGQNVEVLYGYLLDNQAIEWIPGAKLLLKEWSADDKTMGFSASDRFDGMDGTYDRGEYHPEGISLYNLAEDVFQDAGVDSRDYWIDTYLKDVKIVNPVPMVTHKEALQLIANAGRCMLYQDRKGNIYLKSSFIPDMTASSDDGTEYSKAGNVLIENKKDEYASYAADFSKADGNQFFITSSKSYLNTGYVSREISGEDGCFETNPVVTLDLEASHTCFGFHMEFGGNPPDEFMLHTYRDEKHVEDIMVDDIGLITTVSHEFQAFDRMVVEFIKAPAYNRVLLNYVGFGDITDYHLEYGYELSKTPKGIQMQKVKELQVVQTLYSHSNEDKELLSEVISISEENNQFTFYFNSPSYHFVCAVTEPERNGNITLLSSSAYYITIEVTGVSGLTGVTVCGKEYVITQAKTIWQLNTIGTMETWENPLVSSADHAASLAEWIGNYLKADREYDLSYRGEPRIDANDILFLENKYVDGMLVKVYDHTLNFNGALSGSMKARRFIDVDTT